MDESVIVPKKISLNTIVEKPSSKSNNRCRSENSNNKGEEEEEEEAPSTGKVSLSKVLSSPLPFEDGSR